MMRKPRHWYATWDDRFLSRVWFTDGCWLWTGAKRGNYGFFANWPAHHFAYMQLVGPIPEGLCLDHLCCVTLCVRPEHLEPVTVSVNSMRGAWRRQLAEKGEAR